MPEKSIFAQLARQSLEAYVRKRQIIAPPDPLPPELQGQAGVFVSLKKNGELRGCIGTILPTQPNVAAEIIANAISAGTRDLRFPPVRPEELPAITISVDVLTKPEPIASEADLDPKIYGVIVEKGFRRGLLLPDLEGIETVAEQVAIAKQKAGISPWEDVKLYRFQVIRYV